MYYGLTMSFIERLKAEKAEADKQAAKAFLAREESNRQLEQDQRQDIKRAVEHLRRSGALDMAEQLALAIGGVYELKNDVITVAWSLHKADLTMDRYAQVFKQAYIGFGMKISSTPDGRLSVMGGDGSFGPTFERLSPDQRERNPGLLEKAIERAYKHPIIVRHLEYRYTKPDRY